MSKTVVIEMDVPEHLDGFHEKVVAAVIRADLHNFIPGDFTADVWVSSNDTLEENQ